MEKNPKYGVLKVVEKDTIFTDKALKIHCALLTDKGK